MAAETKPKGRAVRLRVTSCTHGYTGKNARGDDYTIYEVEACKVTGEGEPVTEKLRSFEDLPCEVLDLTVVPFHSEKHGTSYTLSRRNKPKSAELIAAQQKEIEGLKSRLEHIENFLRTAPWRQQQQPQQQQEPEPAAVANDLDQRFGAEP